MDAVEYLKNGWNSNPQNKGSDYDAIFWEPGKPRVEICPNGHYLDAEPWQGLYGLYKKII